jgi:hypothetical protein
MATNPFDHIKRPVCGEFIEIGQPTYTELISVREKTTKPAIGNATPDVGIALREVAFGKSCRGETQDPSTPGVFTADTPAADADVPAQKYTIGKQSGKSYKDKVQDLAMAKSTAEFRNLIANPQELIVAQTVKSACPSPCPDPCEDTGGTLIFEASEVYTRSVTAFPGGELIGGRSTHSSVITGNIATDTLEKGVLRIKTVEAQAPPPDDPRNSISYQECHF